MSSNSGRIGLTEAGDEIITSLLEVINDTQDIDSIRVIKKDLYRLAVCVALKDIAEIPRVKLDTNKNFRLNEIDSDGTIQASIEAVQNGDDKSDIASKFEVLANHGLSILQSLYEESSSLDISLLFADA